MRLFIAIEIPDDIKKALGTLQIGIPGARWVKVDQIHLTMAFLGQQQKQKLPPFSVREITLFQSRLTPQGAVHIPIRNFQLASSGFND